MSFVYIGSVTPVSTASGTSLTIDVTTGGAAVGYLMIATFAFEGVGAGSGPYIDPSGSGPGTGVIGPGSNWKQVGFQAPSASGNGIEVWSAIYVSGTTAKANFTGTFAAVGVCSIWSGEYNPTGLITGGAVRAYTSAQVTGNNPAAPTLFVYRGELVVVTAADQLTTPGFTPPTGYTERTDAERGGSFGNVEATIADAVAGADGFTGSLPFTATAATGTTKGTTVTIAIRPSGATPTATSPLVVAEYPVAF